jgi:hypothetical protein
MTKFFRFNNMHLLLQHGFGVFVFLLLGSSHSFAQNNRETLEADPSKYQWKLDSVDDRCMSYSSDVAGKPYVAAKIICNLPIRMEVIGMILRDIDSYPKWMSGCKDARMVKMEDAANDTFVFWWHHHIPILQDRDIVLRVTTAMNLSKGFELVDVRSTDDTKFSPDASLARMPSAWAPFKLEWIDRENTRVSWMIDLNVGDGVPPPIANAIIKKIPGKSMAGLARMATEKKYLEGAKSTRYGQLVEEAIKLGYLR